MVEQRLISAAVAAALREDLNTGDITTMSAVPKDKRISGSFIAKAGGVLCGLDVARAVFTYIDPEIRIMARFKDGDTLDKGDKIATIHGHAVSVLTGERVALNFLQRLSGIATGTREAVKKVAGYPIRILDTRKTTPGLRVFEKYAVKTGGGHNHRFTLSDGILIKDNHIKAAGGIKKAVEKARDFAPHTLKIEVEVETIAQVEEALEAGAEIIMLDNMTLKMMEEAVKRIGKKAQVEASGNMDERDLKAVAATGVDFISIGALTNAVKPMDISLKFD